MQEVMDVANSKRKNKKVDKHKEDKSVDVLISKKKRKGVQFILKEDPLYTPHMQCYINIGIMDKLCSTLPEVAFNQICASFYFAQISSMHCCHVQAQLFSYFMLREVEGNSTDAIMIYINGTTLRFTRRDFCLVFGLKCSDDLSQFVFNTEEPNIILHMYFSERKNVSKAEFVQSFNNKVWGDNADDALKFGILNFIHSYILSEQPIFTTIERIDFDLIEFGLYMDYPWGNKAFEKLAKYIHGKMTRTWKYYRIMNFLLLCKFSFMNKSDHIPRILNWVTKKDYPRIESFMKGMFSDITFRNITPIPLEIAIISLMSEYVQSDTVSPPIPPSKIETDDGKENIVSYSRISPTKKRLRQSVLVISKKTAPKVCQDHNIKSPHTRNDPVSLSVKTRRVRHTKQPAIAVTKTVINQLHMKRKNSNDTYVTSSTSESSQINISHVEFDLFKFSVKKEFTDLRKLIQDNFNVVLNVNVQKQDSTGGVDQSDHNMQNAIEHIICVAPI
ncbi:hypothetical protein H5410_021106 [Solanum commersonii]|uniref:DUF1985 domain-containing protein n=1 Tax=Solanum commersonii TaxID=4109 RepID=A0A9J5ZAE2_SOLCO|nr:hypothetical protein H5410_021106 [Solanum commersonii]